MENKVKILKITKNVIFRDEVKILALGDCEAVFDSFLEKKKFYLKNGYKRIIKMRSKDAKLLEEGEVLDFKNICNIKTAWQFDWKWYY